jgi:hypothetical protein
LALLDRGGGGGGFKARAGYKLFWILSFSFFIKMQIFSSTKEVTQHLSKDPLSLLHSP